jgi:hypothetical protein
MAAVTRLVTYADVDGVDTGQVSVSARHEAELDDGSRVLLLDDRGWGSTQPWAAASGADIRETARMVVGPDEPSVGRSHADMDADHWDVLGQVLRRAGVVVDAAELRRLPHDVELGPALLARLRPDLAR